LQNKCKIYLPQRRIHLRKGFDGQEGRKEYFGFQKFCCHSRLDRESRIVFSQEGNRNALIPGSRFRGNDEKKIFFSLRSCLLRRIPGDDRQDEGWMRLCGEKDFENKMQKLLKEGE